MNAAKKYLISLLVIAVCTLPVLAFAKPPTRIPQPPSPPPRVIGETPRIKGRNIITSPKDVSGIGKILPTDPKATDNILNQIFNPKPIHPKDWAGFNSQTLSGDDLRSLLDMDLRASPMPARAAPINGVTYDFNGFKAFLGNGMIKLINYYGFDVDVPVTVKIINPLMADLPLGTALPPSVFIKGKYDPPSQQYPNGLITITAPATFFSTQDPSILFSSIQTTYLHELLHHNIQVKYYQNPAQLQKIMDTLESIRTHYDYSSRIDPKYQAHFNQQLATLYEEMENFYRDYLLRKNFGDKVQPDKAKELMYLAWVKAEKEGEEALRNQIVKTIIENYQDRYFPEPAYDDIDWDFMTMAIQRTSPPPFVTIPWP